MFKSPNYPFGVVTGSVGNCLKQMSSSETFISEIEKVEKNGRKKVGLKITEMLREGI